MGQAGRKFRPHPGPLPQEREKWVPRSNRAAQKRRLSRTPSPLSDTAGGDPRCSDGREKKQKQSDGL